MRFGEPGGIRTPDLRLRRPLLYPTELLIRSNGAGDGNRTHATSLEGWCSTIELHPQKSHILHALYKYNYLKLFCQTIFNNLIYDFYFYFW